LKLNAQKYAPLHLTTRGQAETRSACSTPSIVTRDIVSGNGKFSVMPIRAEKECVTPSCMPVRCFAISGDIFSQKSEKSEKGLSVNPTGVQFLVPNSFPLVAYTFLEKAVYCARRNLRTTLVFGRNGHRIAVVTICL